MTAQQKNHPKSPEEDQRIEKREARIDHQLEETFPASDPPSYSQPGNTFNKKGEKDIPSEEEEPTLYSHPESDYKHEDEKDREKRIDAQLDQSFPASDPPSYSKPGNTLKDSE